MRSIELEMDDLLPERIELVQAIPDLFGGLMLLDASVGLMQAPGVLARIVGWLGLGATAALGVVFLLEVRSLRRGSTFRIDRLDLAIGVGLLLLAAHGTLEGGGVSRPDLVVGLALVAKGLVVQRVRERFGMSRSLSIDEVGIRLRLTRFRRLELRWRELAEIRTEADRVTLVSRTGRRYTLRLRRYRNQAQIRAAFESIPHSLLRPPTAAAST